VIDIHRVPALTAFSPSLQEVASNAPSAAPGWVHPEAGALEWRLPQEMPPSKLLQKAHEFGSRSMQMVGRAKPAESKIATMADLKVASAIRVAHDYADVVIASASGLALAFTAVFLLAVPMAGNMAGARDFVAYWATGRQLVSHADPYDRVAVMRIEQAAGLPPNAVLLMRNPPWALPLAYPLGFIGLRVATVLWSLMLIACLVISVRLVWTLHGRPGNYLVWLGYSFPPALICLIMGQTSLLALLGLVLFLRFHRSWPFLAGVSLWLCALKPHLFLPFGVVLLVWALSSRTYRLLAGAAAALAASCVAAYWIDSEAWTRYLRMMRSPAVENEFIPCLSDAVRLWLRPQSTWLQYLPAALCCVWALAYYWPRRRDWDWKTQGSLLMLVSLVAAPYCWLYDQGLAIPALLQAAYLTRSRKLLAALAAISIILDLEFCAFKITSPYYLWTAPVWLIWYLLACAATGNKQAPQEPGG